MSQSEKPNGEPSPVAKATWQEKRIQQFELWLKYDEKSRPFLSAAGRDGGFATHLHIVVKVTDGEPKQYLAQADLQVHRCKAGMQLDARRTPDSHQLAERVFYQLMTKVAERICHAGFREWAHTQLSRTLEEAVKYEVELRAIDVVEAAKAVRQRQQKVSELVNQLFPDNVVFTARQSNPEKEAS